MGVWHLYRQSQAFGSSPSAIFGIRGNPWLAWQFDNAVLLFGTWGQNRLDEKDKDGKPKYRTLAAALDIPPARVTVFNVGQLKPVPGVRLSE